MIKLGDFGLAVQLDNSKSVRNTVCGTPWFMAPEVYNGAAEVKSDVWALGISLIELAEGKNPYAGLKSSAEIVNKVVTVRRLRCLHRSGLNGLWTLLGSAW